MPDVDEVELQGRSMPTLVDAHATWHVRTLSVGVHPEQRDALHDLRDLDEDALLQVERRSEVNNPPRQAEEGERAAAKVTREQLPEAPANAYALVNDRD